MNKKQAIQFEEGECLIDKDGYRLEVKDGKWRWYCYQSRGYKGVDFTESLILNALTEIVKPLRTHKIGQLIYREDGMFSHEDLSGWCECALPADRDLFTSWGWPIPAHMEDK